MDFDLDIGSPIVTVSFHFGLTNCFVLSLAIIFGLSVAYSDPYFQISVAHSIIAAQETLRDVKKHAVDCFALPVVTLATAVLYLFGLL